MTSTRQGTGRVIAPMLAYYGAGGVMADNYVTERAEVVATEIPALGEAARTNERRRVPYLRTRVLMPELFRRDMAIMNNLSGHKAVAVRAAIESVGARLLFLLPYSPDFNLIEQAFVKLKAHLCRATEPTIHGLWNAIGRMFDVYSLQNCANYSANCGYDAD